MKNLYEEEGLKKSLGLTLRPGGHALAKLMIEENCLNADNQLLDIGCGRGATLNYLKDRLGTMGTGLDCSKILLQECRESGLSCVNGKGEALPFKADSFNCVLSECSLSLMEAPLVVNEVHRVLQNDGYWGIADLYAKRPGQLRSLENKGLNTCISKLHDLESLVQTLEKAGFKIICLNEVSSLLKDLTIKLIFEYGSMNNFWSEYMGDGKQCQSDFQKGLKSCKPGYFMMIVQKK
ncbi:class I SAM-dependent methyltransferase [Eubacteriaceae bacterium ES3]|nr:class I SAM-dependent methyltransferase [Eubacteriaceae bacterium ES3]